MEVLRANAQENCRIDTEGDIDMDYVVQKISASQTSLALLEKKEEACKYVKSCRLRRQTLTSNV